MPSVLFITIPSKLTNQNQYYLHKAVALGDMPFSASTEVQLNLPSLSASSVDDVQVELFLQRISIILTVLFLHTSQRTYRNNNLDSIFHLFNLSYSMLLLPQTGHRSPLGTQSLAKSTLKFK
jgi:hypothetical protein